MWNRGSHGKHGDILMNSKTYTVCSSCNMCNKFCIWSAQIHQSSSHLLAMVQQTEHDVPLLCLECWVSAYSSTCSLHLQIFRAWMSWVGLKTLLADTVAHWISLSRLWTCWYLSLLKGNIAQACRDPRQGDEETPFVAEEVGEGPMPPTENFLWKWGTEERIARAGKVKRPRCYPARWSLHANLTFAIQAQLCPLSLSLSEPHICSKDLWTPYLWFVAAVPIPETDRSPTGSVQRVGLRFPVSTKSLKQCEHIFSNGIFPHLDQDAKTMWAYFIQRNFFLVWIRLECCQAYMSATWLTYMQMRGKCIDMSVQLIIYTSCISSGKYLTHKHMLYLQTTTRMNTLLIRRFKINKTLKVSSFELTNKETQTNTDHPAHSLFLVMWIIGDGSIPSSQCLLW